MGQATRELQYAVERLSCSSCRMLVTEELEELEGVDAVDVDLERKLVTVRGATLDDARIRALLDEIGYAARPS